MLYSHRVAAIFRASIDQREGAPDPGRAPRSREARTETLVRIGQALMIIATVALFVAYVCGVQIR